MAGRNRPPPSGEKHQPYTYPTFNEAEPRSQGSGSADSRRQSQQVHGGPFCHPQSMPQQTWQKLHNGDYATDRDPFGVSPSYAMHEAYLGNMHSKHQQPGETDGVHQHLGYSHNHRSWAEVTSAQNVGNVADSVSDWELVDHNPQYDLATASAWSHDGMFPYNGGRRYVGTVDGEHKGALNGASPYGTTQGSERVGYTHPSLDHYEPYTNQSRSTLDLEPPCAEQKPSILGPERLDVFDALPITAAELSWSGLNMRGDYIATTTEPCIGMTGNQLEEIEGYRSTKQASAGSSTSFHSFDMSVDTSLTSFTQEVNDIRETNGMTDSMLTIRPSDPPQGEHTQNSNYVFERRQPLGLGNQGPFRLTVECETPSPDKDNQSHILVGSASSLCSDWQHLSVESTHPSSSDTTSTASASSLSTSNVLYCDEPGCDKEFHGEHRKGNRGRHRRQKHQKTGAKTYSCEVKSCAQVFQRSDALLNHCRKDHPEIKKRPAQRRTPRKSEGAEPPQVPLVTPQNHSQQDQALMGMSSWM
ncbi:hypothetical protein P153DRAFT_383495 [Dothidotthia symphoricarpi CBS 119687]|uniref:C2H2-type domain-containing protein n=1 Tax=Dothidotthia symphoricarpi CBS 119687 TaxID=1392245 RepID=A0A6A6AKE3_9PLEO|nr:uncharacterized protein P153DRAFT_383495 [Dothidotthia symphoricarpi CBS 119687]KAF2131384.1 hypothetical protein P153DRAFT_383495 [Dothidotthia symphoricarpi CBS 119687]